MYVYAFWNRDTEDLIHCLPGISQKDHDNLSFNNEGQSPYEIREIINWYHQFSTTVKQQESNKRCSNPSKTLTLPPHTSNQKILNPLLAQL